MTWEMMNQLYIRAVCLRYKLKPALYTNANHFFPQPNRLLIWTNFKQLEQNSGLHFLKHRLMATYLLLTGVI